MIRSVIKLTTNIGVALLALVSNGVILAAPPYLLWELFLAADLVVLPNAFVSVFRTLFYFKVFVVVV